MKDSLSSFQIANYDFALRLAKQLTAGYDETNFLISPASVTIIMAMCYFGANGTTRTELKTKIFGDHVTDQQIKRWTESTLAFELESNDLVAIKFANRLYVNDKFRLKEEFVRMLGDRFKTAVLSENLNRNIDGITDVINYLISNATNYGINDLLPYSSLTPSTALLLVNALYFQAYWEDEFHPSETTKRNFYVSANEIIRVDMMQMTERKPWYEDDEVQILELGYDQTSASMVIILPKRKNNLENLVRTLTGHKLSQWLNNLTFTEVQIQIPKFRIEQALSVLRLYVNDAILDGWELQELGWLGITRAFGATADFSGMINGASNGFRISEIRHKVFLDVDEYGTEAAASYVKMSNMSRFVSNEKPKKFVADHPFLFLLTAGESYDKTLLFIGQFWRKEEKIITN